VWTASSLVAIAALVVVLGFAVVQTVRGPGVQGDPVVVTVPEGMSGREVAKLLAEQGLVDHEILFRIALRIDESGETIKHGSHRVPEGAAPLEILRILQQPPNPSLDANKYKFTVPEGLTVRQIAELMPDPEAFLAEVSGIPMKDEFGIDAPGPEGFLMPNTYFFDEPPTSALLLRRLLDQFKSDYAQLQAEFPEAAKDVFKVVTIASLIEEEVRTDGERPLVSSVIHNRLEKGRALEMDSTLQYVLNKYGQRLLNGDKEVDSPYNTYKYAGLPPGPISNPGLKSLRYALAPADTDYLYFVSNADGKTHTFSKTLREHEAAVAKFRREIREQRRELQQQSDDQ
jgi:UPF0755 protein